MLTFLEPNICFSIQLCIWKLNLEHLLTIETTLLSHRRFKILLRGINFGQVFSVVREQITRALAQQPAELPKFKQRLQLLTYAEITNLWQQERTTREEWESHARPVTQLKEMIMPEIMELIQLQRLGFLVEGTRFTKYSNRGQVRPL